MSHSTIRPELVPASERQLAHMPLLDRFRALKELEAVIFLIGCTVGSMYRGLATPSESAAVGWSARSSWRNWRRLHPAMMALTLPIVLPVVKAAGFDPVWFGVFMVVVIAMLQGEHDAHCPRHRSCRRLGCDHDKCVDGGTLASSLRPLS